MYLSLCSMLCSILCQNTRILIQKNFAFKSFEHTFEQLMNILEIDVFFIGLLRIEAKLRKNTIFVIGYFKNYKHSVVDC